MTLGLIVRPYQPGEIDQPSVERRARKPRPGDETAARLALTEEGHATLARGRAELGAILLADNRLTLAALRLCKGFTQAQLVQASGIPQPQLSRLESGQHDDVLASTLMRLASALGTSLDAVNAAIQQARAARVGAAS